MSNEEKQAPAELTTEVKIEDIAHKLRAHEFMLLPNGQFQLQFDGNQMSVILDSLNKVHGAFVREIMNERNSETARQSAYATAADVENVYDFIIRKLKLFTPSREDLN